MVLDIDGTNIQQWTKTGGSQQEWRIIYEANGYCRIVSLSDEGKCLAVAESSADDGINIELQTYSGADNQLWKLIKSGSYYGIVSKCSDDTAGLDVYDWSTENGGNINQWNYWEGDCQLWKLEPVYPAVNSGLFLADNNGNAVQSSFEQKSSWSAETLKINIKNSLLKYVLCTLLQKSGYLWSLWRIKKFFRRNH